MKVNVNMTPNPVDIQTIHCSQGDTEARKFEFSLHNNSEVIDTSSFGEEIMFPVSVGGTEQILPVNGSSPSTSPFVGDITYPDGIRTDQEFLYRESPTSEDGMAKADSIKGNTLVWNQLVKNGNFSSTSNFIIIGATNFSVDNNVASFDVLTNDDRLQQNMVVFAGHKYLVRMDVLNASPNNLRIFWGSERLRIAPSNSWVTSYVIIDTSSLVNGTYALGLRLAGTISSSATIQTKNWNCFDLTQMFGAGNEPTLEEFKSLFSLPYYDYNAGSLLSFNGTGIKTTGKNLWDNSNLIKGSVPTEYEPYTESTTSLPISTYFPTGMKSAGSVYDELTSNKAITRIGSVDLGTLTYGVSGAGLFNTTSLSTLIKPAAWSAQIVKAICPLYTATYGQTVYNKTQEYVLGTDGNGIMYIYDPSKESMNAQQFKTVMSGVMLYFELATPTEQSITTASLVSENGDIPLKNEDGVLVGECNSEFSSIPGFHDCKIKLVDSDGVTYSNKVQLHVERKPS